MTRWLSLLVMVMSVAAPLQPCRAGVTLVLFEGSGDEDEDEARGVIRRRMGPLAAEFGAISSALSPAAGDLFVIGMSLSPCGSAEVRAPDDLVRSIDDAERSIDDLEFEAAADALDQVGQSLGCVTSAVAPDALARYHLLSGLLRYFDEGEAAAVELFQRTLLVSPHLEWDPAYPPDAQRAFTTAAIAALRVPRGRLNLGSRLNSAGASWLDGRPLVGPVAELTLGTHTLQWGSQSALLEVNDVDGELSLLLAEDLVERATGNTGTSLERELLSAALARAAQEQQAARVLLVRRGEPGLIHRFEASTGVLELESEDDLRRRIRRGRGLRGGGVGLSVGGGVSVAFGVALAVAAVRTAERLRETVLPEDGYGELGEVEAIRVEYDAASQRVQVGTVLAGLGGAMIIVGIPIWAVGDGHAKGKLR